MKTLVGKFKFTVPEPHAEAGKELDKAFEYPQCESETEATETIASKKWKMLEIVNDKLRRNARSNAYQAASLPYRPSDVPPDDIKERMIRDYIRLGVPEEMARKQVDALLGASAADTDSE